MLIVSLVFSILYEANQDRMWSGVFASICWLTFGLFYFVAFATYAERLFSTLFVGLGMLYMIRLIVTVSRSMDPRKFDDDEI